MRKRFVFRVPFLRSATDKWTAGPFNILCFDFPDTFPRKINNFLWWVRDLPIIHWISIFCSRGGADRCVRCRKFLWPHDICVGVGNVYEKIGSGGRRCNKDCPIVEGSVEHTRIFWQSHFLFCQYRPGYFCDGVLGGQFDKLIEETKHANPGTYDTDIVELMKEYPIHQMVKDKLKEIGKHRDLKH